MEVDERCNSPRLRTWIKVRERALHRQPVTNVIQLAYDVPDFLQARILEDGGPTDIWEMCKLVEQRFDVTMRSGELAEMLRCAGVSLTRDERGQARFSAFSPAYEALRTARGVAQSARPNDTPVSKAAGYIPPTQLYSAALMLQAMSDERLQPGESCPVSDLVDALWAKYPEAKQIAAPALCKQFYALGRYESYAKNVGGIVRRYARRKR